MPNDQTIEEFIESLENRSCDELNELYLDIRARLHKIDQLQFANNQKIDTKKTEINALRSDIEDYRHQIGYLDRRIPQLLNAVLECERWTIDRTGDLPVGACRFQRDNHQDAVEEKQRLLNMIPRTRAKITTLDNQIQDLDEQNLELVEEEALKTEYLTRVRRRLLRRCDPPYPWYE